MKYGYIRKLQTLVVQKPQENVKPGACPSIHWLEDRRRMIEEVKVIFGYKAKFEATPGYRMPWRKREKWETIKQESYQALLCCLSWMQFSHWVMLTEKAVNLSKSKVAFDVFSGPAEGRSAPDLGSEKKLWGQVGREWEQERT